jgi:hypothetical protein
MKEELLGVYDNTEITYIVNEKEIYLFNASVVAKMFNLDLSNFIKKDAHTLITSLISLPKSNKYKQLDLEDVVLIENGVYYFHKLILYKLVYEVDVKFYWWFDQLLYQGMTEKDMFIN